MLDLPVSPVARGMIAALFLFGCSAAKTGGTGGSSTGGSSTGGGGEGGATTSSTTSSSGGGTMSTGGAGATGGTTGGGGMTTSSSTGGAGATGGVGGGGTGGGTGGVGGETTTSTTSTTSAPTAKVVLVAGSAAAMIGGAYDEASGWTVTAINSNLGGSPSVALASPSEGVAFFRTSADSHWLYTKWDGSTFTAPLSIGMLATGQATASMSYGESAYQIGYWGVDNKHYFARYAGQGGGWSPVAEAVMPAGGGQSFGSSPPSVAALGTEVYLVHAGTDGKVYEQRRSGGQWNAATGHDVGGVQTTITPAAAALSGNQEDLMIVYVVSANSQIGWLTRKPGNPPVWNAGALIPNALTQDRVALAPLPGGGAVMAFRGLNTNVYTSVYTPGANPAWSAPLALANPNYSTPSTPALAPGVGGATAELCFADGASGKAMHARLVGGAWQSPVEVGGAGVTLVGMSSAP